MWRRSACSPKWPPGWGRNGDAESLLESCLELAPSFHAARHQYVVVLQRQNKTAAALGQIDQLASIDPRSTIYKNLRAVILGKIGEYAESIDIYAEVLRAHPRDARIWVSYGHAPRHRRPRERQHRSVSPEYRRGAKFWRSLLEFGESQDLPIRCRGNSRPSRRSCGAPICRTKTGFHFDFALGKALEDAGDYPQSFAHYSQGNRLRKVTIGYESDETSAFVQRSKKLFTTEFLAARAGWGAPAADPLFILGMPRAGSTLIEQMLASHSQVEGTMELPDILMIAASLSGKKMPFQRRAEISFGARQLGPRCLPCSGRALPGRHPHPTQDRATILHRQDAAQFPACRPDSAGTAQCEDHRCAPASHGLLFFGI